MNAYSNLKRKSIKLEKLNMQNLFLVKLIHLILKNIKNRYKLPHFEWLPHPLAIILDLFKNKNFKIKLDEKRKIHKKKLYQNLKLFFLKKN